jgi:hypothetical protein
MTAKSRGVQVRRDGVECGAATGNVAQVELQLYAEAPATVTGAETASGVLEQERDSCFATRTSI